MDYSGLANVLQVLPETSDGAWQRRARPTAILPRPLGKAGFVGLLRMTISLPFRGLDGGNIRSEASGRFLPPKLPGLRGGWLATAGGFSGKRAGGRVDQAIDSQSLPNVVVGRARGGRETQQDAVACMHDPATGTRLLVLADGMGGDGAGELAADGVIKTARQLWIRAQWRHQSGSFFLETLCQEAHAELVRRREGLRAGEPHSTVVALLLRGKRAYWAHVGDSRLYRFQGRRCLGRTLDHSLSQRKLERGEITAAQLASDPDQNVLLRGLGGEQPPVVEHGSARLRPGQSFALCSDGVWAQLSTQELRRLSLRRDQTDALHEALWLATSRGGEAGDNAALIFVQVGGGWMRRCGERLLEALRPAHALHATDDSTLTDNGNP